MLWGILDPEQSAERAPDLKRSRSNAAARILREFVYGRRESRRHWNLEDRGQHGNRPNRRELDANGPVEEPGCPGETQRPVFAGR